MTKEDYMRLSKERLAELLVENAIFIKEPRVEILDHYNVGDRVRIVILKAEG